MVPCEGLYSDIVDDFLRQNTMKGRGSCFIQPITQSISGFHEIKQGFGESTKHLHAALEEDLELGKPSPLLFSHLRLHVSDLEEWSQANRRLYAVLQKLFPNSLRDEQGPNLDELTKVYLNYKMKYLKHLFFSPDGKKLCEYILWNLF